MKLSENPLIKLSKYTVFLNNGCKKDSALKNPTKMTNKFFLYDAWFSSKSSLKILRVMLVNPHLPVSISKFDLLKNYRSY